MDEQPKRKPHVISEQAKATMAARRATYRTMAKIEAEIVALADEYGVKPGEVKREMLLFCLNQKIYQQANRWRLEYQASMRQWEARREAKKQTEAQQERQAQPIAERTYGHLRLVKGSAT